MPGQNKTDSLLSNQNPPQLVEEMGQTPTSCGPTNQQSTARPYGPVSAPPPLGLTANKVVQAA
jgi:hypothetical protein